MRELRLGETATTGAYDWALLRAEANILTEFFKTARAGDPRVEQYLRRGRELQALGIEGGSLFRLPLRPQ